MKRIDSRELSEHCDIPLATVRKWGRELIRFGKPTRIAGYTLNEAFKVFLACNLSRDFSHRIPSSAIRGILMDVWPWLELRGLVPEPDKFQPNSEDEHVSNYEVWMYELENGAFFYLVRGRVQAPQLEEYKGIQVWQARYVEYPLLIARTKEEASQIARKFVYTWDRPRIFFASALLCQFVNTLSGEKVYSDWRKERVRVIRHALHGDAVEPPSSDHREPTDELKI